MSRRFATHAFLLVLAAAGMPSRALADGVVSGPEGARIDSFMTAVAELGVSGSLLVEHDGRVIVHKGYGVVNRETGARAEAETPYLLGSLSKQFTAAAIYKLESQGKLSLADSIAKWLPGVPDDKRAITIDMLVHHTSGFIYLAGGLFDSISTDSMVRAVLASRLDFTPGARYQYSNPGYNLLAPIIERASGMSFNAYLRSAIFVPAGMTHTAFSDEPELWPAERRTPSYSATEVDPPLYPTGRLPYTTGAGTVVSTCGDLWKWEQALRSGTVLDAAATAKYLAPGPDAGPNTRYAGGWNVAKSARNTTVMMHGGDLGGFNVDMRRFLDEHATLVFLSNGRQGGRGFREVVSPSITRLLFGPRLELPPPHRGEGVERVARTQEEMSRLAGSDSTGRAAEARASAWAASVVDSLIHVASANTAADLGGRFHPSIPVDQHGGVFEFWRAEADSAGAGAKATVLGSVATGPNAVRTFVELKGARARRVVSLDWVRDRVTGTEPVPAGGYVARFWDDPTAKDMLARYDLWNGRVVRVSRRSS
jgi:CubicO group peptidase (beta-lactamase class C family)